MTHDQSLKFLGKRVFLVQEDQTLFRGILEEVCGSICVVRAKDKSIKAHIQYLFPDKSK